MTVGDTMKLRIGDSVTLECGAAVEVTGSPYTGKSWDGSKMSDIACVETYHDRLGYEEVWNGQIAGGV